MYTADLPHDSLGCRYRLQDVLEAAQTMDKNFEANWEIVLDWSEEARYNLNISREDALELYSAITMRRTGIMTWLRNHW
jgi:hypothetical protein